MAYMPLPGIEKKGGEVTKLWMIFQILGIFNPPLDWIPPPPSQPEYAPNSAGTISPPLAPPALSPLAAK